LNEPRTVVDGGDAQPAVACIHKLVELVRLRNQDLIGDRLDGVVADGERCLSFDHDEHLGIRMPVELRPAPWLAIEKDERDIDIAEVATFEAVRTSAMRQISQGYRIWHGFLSIHAQYTMVTL
jgi:hypothetical protein